MKTYIVYVNGVEAGMVKAASQNAAEKKAKAKYACAPKYDSTWGTTTEANISVAYTEM